MYLTEPIKSREQQDAFETVISFQDRIYLEIPADLQSFLDEVTKNFDANFVADISGNMEKAVHDPESYIDDNREELEQYMAFIQSDEYKKTPVYKLQELFAAFHRESGYDGIFVPAMKRLSPSYRKYQEEMEKANKIFKKNYPNTVSQQKNKVCQTP